MSTPSNSSTMTINSINLREVHHAEFNHVGSYRTCDDCDRDELIESNGYVAGLNEWYEEVGRYLNAINGSVGGSR